MLKNLALFLCTWFVIVQIACQGTIDNPGQKPEIPKGASEDDARAKNATLMAANLNNGATVTGLSASNGEWHHYKIPVPANASNLLMKITCNNGDADLYTRRGAEPTTSSYDCRPY
jgi:hypothetical protein